MKKYLKLMRIHHYVKNLLIFLPLIFNGQLFDGKAFLLTFFGFLAFCAISSVVYIINDMRDVENDRKHSEKRKRPIASGSVSMNAAKALSISLFCLAVYFCYLSSSSLHMPWIFISIYFVLNLLYSFGLKKIPIIDIAILVSGFLLRVIFGASITDIIVSNWLYLTIMSISFYLGLGKRRNEASREKESRDVLRHYNYAFLDKNMYMCLACAFVFYALWCVDATTITRYQTNALVWTVPIAILIGMKYSLNVEGSSDGDPVEVIMKDKILLSMIAIYGVIIIALLYF